MLIICTKQKTTFSREIKKRKTSLQITRNKKENFQYAFRIAIYLQHFIVIESQMKQRNNSNPTKQQPIQKIQKKKNTLTTT